MTNFKSYAQQIEEILERKNVKEIKELFHSEKYNCSNFSDVAELMAQMVVDNSNDFTKDIAQKILDSAGEKYISAKQAWCVAYQIVNNINVYKS